ncbi:hypothetical protein DFH06DRAFT_1048238, partial [Mycena polygramma]
MNTAIRNRSEPSVVEPRLPLELECTIFEMAALSCPSTIPALMRVAQRVRHWVEPILYRVVFMSSPSSSTKQLLPRHIEGFPLIPRDLLLQAIRDKPPSFFPSAVKHIFLDDWPVTLPLQLSEVETILGACSRLSSLFGSCPRTLNSLQFIPALDRLECLHHLFINLESLFEFTPIDFAQPFLRNVTHLELADIHYDFSNHPTGLGEGLALLPHLTHLGL